MVSGCHPRRPSPPRVHVPPHSNVSRQSNVACCSKVFARAGQASMFAAMRAGIWQRRCRGCLRPRFARAKKTSGVVRQGGGMGNPERRVRTGQAPLNTLSPILPSPHSKNPPHSAYADRCHSVPTVANSRDSQEQLVRLTTLSIPAVSGIVGYDFNSHSLDAAGPAAVTTRRASPAGALPDQHHPDRTPTAPQIHPRPKTHGRDPIQLQRSRSRPRRNQRLTPQLAARLRPASTSASAVSTVSFAATSRSGGQVWLTPRV